MSLQDWPETEKHDGNSWTDYQEDYGNWSSDQAYESHDWESQDYGNWPTNHGAWPKDTQEDMQSWSTDHDSMAAGSHHDDGTWNQGVKNDHADGHCADQQDRCCFFQYRFKKMHSSPYRTRAQSLCW